MRCPNCNESFANGYSSCPHCGTRISVTKDGVVALSPPTRQPVPKTSEDTSSESHTPFAAKLYSKIRNGQILLAGIASLFIAQMRLVFFKEKLDLIELDILLYIACVAIGIAARYLSGIKLCKDGVLTGCVRVGRIFCLIGPIVMTLNIVAAFIFVY